ncbi:Transcriptional regulator, TetR family [Pseudonocardia sp. Ae168_Ps1]|jgi:AcrR family transcriptional regulator|uniref:TetR/AcrR family transcriptional regulator n=1 Tax=unclassified Pseudonocardia TaxID=2619320 RepID=UPI0006CB3A43|nr:MULTISPECIES: TetR/AcrR family transcriptional regulator [unclassified Pseudonocardia]ALE75526.1 TetR family transcriptional regulator [Pseudonocardia sp. EC080625-04]ALL74899.1 TetR family transcriptional regulator [Pseudonocardia sp. EC080610-09]ALL81921.1 TetR family transcriptional regulator [Pseudonocardia sp. EC080619-01]OLL75055.1 Transcriptional regulator, TetR family [Pseudonocardia sp. Ae150A_Ps1]OLL81050.1 Transcriptional regulator, TetR family [Pseudonocardia sp. Ae168_Ps1]
MPRPSRWPDLVHAAGEEFRERGYDNATLESIGARVGILKGSVYNYVSSKEELLLAVVEQPAQALLAELDRLRADTGSSVAMRLRELVRTQIRIFADYYPAAFVYLQHVGRFRSPTFARFDDMDRRYIAAVESLLAEGARNGEFSLAGDPAVAARAIVGMLDWMQHWFTPHGEEADSQLADQIFALALGGLVAAGGIHGLAKGTPYAARTVPTGS